MTETRSSIRNLETQVGQLANMLNNRSQGNLPSNTVVNPKEQCQAIDLRSSKQVEPVASLPPAEKTYKFGETSNLEKEGVTEDHPTAGNTSPTWTLEQMASYVKFMKEILFKKRKLEDYEIVALTEKCSVILQRKLPQKLRDPGIFTILCTIGKFECQHAQCDLGASINLMPYSVFCRLGENETLPVIVSSYLSKVEVEKLLRVLRAHKLAIGWTLADIREISPSKVMHKIRLEDESRPSIEA
ncbi:hypothetical protein K7X08_032658 [Anisodus acutangulus]|uniref:Uncharacterized protein n=1 Tax=Anisodus acutangulus TaxID=402998 RepID=A0A9Q1RSA5_9SOLA|nr:hypothetical protein K7X08_032658 [Anisodus acutangulus]